MLTFLGFAAEPPSCLSNPDDAACHLIWNTVGSTWLAENSHWLVVRPMRIVLIVAVCLIVRTLVNRAIKRLTFNTAEGASPTILRPFRERMPNLMTDADTAALLGDRRRQRAETMGSVLRNLVTWLVLAVMFLLILSEFNVNLAPLLASAGVVGVALGFGAQTLVRDVLSGIFMIMEDQYGVGDVVDLGEASGTVEMVGLRVTTVRDISGTLWYVRNGEVLRVGNHSQGWAQVILDVPLDPAVDVDAAGAAIVAAAAELAEDPQWAESITDAPEALGVVDMTMDGAVYRIQVKTSSPDQWAVGRELRRRVSHALRAAGIADAMSDNRVYVRRGRQQGADGGSQ
ncbi:MAG: mechanosensitive ion channel family protein [Stackebrandtia sp.]